jgi:methylenetetrahydrofolate reductase (NADPH)
MLKAVHDRFFNAGSPLAAPLRALARRLDGWAPGRFLVHLLEDPAKALLLACRRCGDCGIQHVAFLCPESQCPKHIRNGAFRRQPRRLLRGFSRARLRLVPGL